jgi:hypothetical protein
VSHDTSKGLSKRARLDAANEQAWLVLADLNGTGFDRAV